MTSFITEITVTLIWILWVFKNSKGRSQIPCNLCYHCFNPAHLYNMTFCFVLISMRLDPGRELWSSIGVESLWTKSVLPCFWKFWRLICITSLPDSSSSKVNFANLTLWDWVIKKMDRMNEAQRGREQEKEKEREGEIEREREREGAWQMECYRMKKTKNNETEILETLENPVRLSSRTLDLVCENTTVL